MFGRREFYLCCIFGAVVILLEFKHSPYKSVHVYPTVKFLKQCNKQSMNERRNVLFLKNGILISENTLNKMHSPAGTSLEHGRLKSRRIFVNLAVPSWDSLVLLTKHLLPGGRFKPHNCTNPDRVAIIVPYRNRTDQLKMFLRHMHPFLQRQQIQYGVYIIEQKTPSECQTVWTEMRRRVTQRLVWTPTVYDSNHELTNGMQNSAIYLLHKVVTVFQSFHKVKIITGGGRLHMPFAPGLSFNRGVLMNIGFAEASKRENYQCFVFHDVDLLPEDDANMYTCPSKPRHMSTAIDAFKYRLPYHSIMGGVIAMSKQHFKKINGFSNSYFGWGGEDDDLYKRIRHAGLKFIRYALDIGRYKMITHKQEASNLQRREILELNITALPPYSSPLNNESLHTTTLATVSKQEGFRLEWDLLSRAIRRVKNDGINSLKYEVIDTTENTLYSRIIVNIRSPGKLKLR